MKNELTQAQLKELLHYDPETGIFTWLVSRSNRVKVGGVAGGLNGSGYVVITIQKIKYPAHRLAFLYMEGAFPENQVDHQKHVRHDNRWKRISHATHSENGKNRSMSKNNTSGHVGVCWTNHTRRWYASITVNKKTIYLGSYLNKLAAINAREVANIKYEFHVNHGLEQRSGAA